MRGVFLGLILLAFAIVTARALNCQPCKLLEARKTHANETHTQPKWEKVGAWGSGGLEVGRAVQNNQQLVRLISKTYAHKWRQQHVLIPRINNDYESQSYLNTRSETTTSSAQRNPIQLKDPRCKYEVPGFVGPFGPVDHPLFGILGGQLLSLRPQDEGNRGVRLKWRNLQEPLRVRVHPAGL